MTKIHTQRERVRADCKAGSLSTAVLAPGLLALFLDSIRCECVCRLYTIYFLLYFKCNKRIIVIIYIKGEEIRRRNLRKLSGNAQSETTVLLRRGSVKLYAGLPNLIHQILCYYYDDYDFDFFGPVIIESTDDAKGPDHHFL